MLYYETNPVYVLGGSQTDFERNWTKEGKNEIALLKENIDDALKSAQIVYEEIERLNRRNGVACFVGNFIAEKYVDQGHLGALLTEVHPAFAGVPSARYEAACASGSVAIDSAVAKIRSGDYDLAIVVGWELMKTVDSKTGGDYLGRAAYYRYEAAGTDFPFPKLFGKLADATIEKYGLDESQYMECLAKIAVNNYENGRRNPLAQTRHWFMDLEQASHRGTDTNPKVGGKLAISDCSQVTDGAVTVILASESYAKAHGFLHKPIVKGYGHRTAPMRFERKLADSKESAFILKWTRQACLDAYQRAGLSMTDIGVFETHDCFTSSEYMAISCFGITEPGKEYEAVESGRITVSGDKPINPSGGLIGAGHPVGASGVRMFLDLYKQVMREAGAYQIEKVKNGMMLNIGGSATTNYSFVIGMMP